jgi:hypothetical protein
MLRTPGEPISDRSMRRSCATSNFLATTSNFFYSRLNLWMLCQSAGVAIVAPVAGFFIG